MISPNQTPSQLIKASAGTGKTHKLSLRILRLLALGTEPRQIVALTFTRSAAAEFVRRAIKLIKDAAEDPKKHLEICGAERGANLDPSVHTQQAFKELLVKTLLQYDQMLLGTLDSYFARLVNNFPLEVGLEPGKASTVPDYQEDDHRQRVIGEIMREIEKDEQLNSHFREQVKEFKGDDAASSPLKIFEKVVEEYLRFYALCPEAGRWGEPEAIWGKNPPEWLAEDYLPAHHDKAWRRLQDWSALVFSTEPPAALRDLGEAIEQKPAADYESALRHLFKMFETFLTTGDLTLKFDGKVYDLSNVAKDITILHRCYAGRHLLGRMKSTRGLYQLLKLYRQRYDQIATRTGKLTFADYVNLLQARFMPGERREEVQAWLDQIHFRLDCQIDHWMLDEFQDTSTTQYAVLSRNILEILGQKFNGRSVFVVGDLKQSLYEWREGNRRLLTQVELAFKRQNKDEDGTALVSELTKTWRCAPAVLAMVNAELGDLKRADVGETFPSSALDDWREVFKTQEAMDHGKKGEAIWVEVTTGEEAPNLDKGIPAQAKWIAHHLRTSPGLLDGGKLSAGLTCAILVGKNDDAEEFAEQLRNLGIRATAEAKSVVTQDNPVTIALISILERAVHPDNMKARALAEICPPVLKALRSFTKSAELKVAWRQAIAHVASTFASGGARAVIDDLIGRTSLDELGGSVKNSDAFINQRLNQLRTMATDYDKLGQRDLGGFVAFATQALHRDGTSPDSVQVVTFHKSKGLEYDAVYIPLLEDSKTMGEIKHDVLIYAPLGEAAADPEDQFAPAWILKNINKAVNPLDKSIRAGIDNIRAEGAYGSLCRLYVGMTRAKHRLVLLHERELKKTKATQKKPSVIAPDPRDKKTGNFDYLDLTTRKLVGDSPLGQSLSEDIGQEKVVNARCLWKAKNSSGEWIQDRLNDEARKTAITDDSDICQTDFTAVAARRLIRIKPSKGKTTPHKRTRSGQHSGKAFGTLVHGLFEGLKWNIDEFLVSTSARLSKDDPTLVQAFDRVVACLNTPEVRELITRNQGGELWTEKHAVLLDAHGEYVSAVFDRVQVSKGKSAIVVDYKTNACTRTELAEIYQEQMDLYRRSVARLCGLAEASVETWLVHVREDGSEVIKIDPKR
jgi:ATP-dependent exoDNAse (exonuclease V) beta subunit